MRNALFTLAALCLAAPAAAQPGSQPNAQQPFGPRDCVAMNEQGVLERFVPPDDQRVEDLTTDRGIRCGPIAEVLWVAQQLDREGRGSGLQPANSGMRPLERAPAPQRERRTPGMGI